MDLTDAVRRRRMTRAFRPDPLDTTLVDGLLDDALRAPTAGNTRGVAWLILSGPAETTRYWTATTTEAWRTSSRRWPGLSPAPVVALALASALRYLQRYGEPDKSSSGLGPPPGGDGEAAWPVPYWYGDAAFSVMTLLLGATDAGLGACFLGNFRGEETLLGELGVPTSWRLFGAVLLGKPSTTTDPLRSTGRP